MRLSWNEIKARAARFADEWRNAHYERGESQTFYNELVEQFSFILGVQKRTFRDQDRSISWRPR